MVPTIDQLFTLIQTEMNTNADQNIYVEYNKEVGYPSHIDFTRSDGSSFVVDVSNFNTVRTPSPTPSLSVELQRLAQAQALWDSLNIPNYEYQFTHYGMRTSYHKYPWTVRVTNSDQVLGRDAYGFQIYWTNTNIRPKSIDQLFATVQEALTANPSYLSVRVIYDDEFGFPRQIFTVDSDDPTHVSGPQILDFQLLV